MKNVYAVFKKGRPISDFMWLNSLDRIKGLKHNETYNSFYFAITFCSLIKEQIMQNIHRELTHANFFSLSMDGSTDASSKEQESLFVRWCKEGKISSHFLCIGEPESTSADNLLAFVFDKIRATGMFEMLTSKLVGFAADGAANMMGNKTGLATQLKAQYLL